MTTYYNSILPKNKHNNLRIMQTRIVTTYQQIIIYYQAFGLMVNKCQESEPA